MSQPLAFFMASLMDETADDEGNCSQSIIGEVANSGEVDVKDEENEGEARDTPSSPDRASTPSNDNAGCRKERSVDRNGSLDSPLGPSMEAVTDTIVSRDLSALTATSSTKNCLQAARRRHSLDSMSMPSLVSTSTNKTATTDKSRRPSLDSADMASVAEAAAKLTQSKDTKTPSKRRTANEKPKTSNKTKTTKKHPRRRKSITNVINKDNGPEEKKKPKRRNSIESRSTHVKSGDDLDGESKEERVARASSGFLYNMLAKSILTLGDSESNSSFADDSGLFLDSNAEKAMLNRYSALTITPKKSATEKFEPQINTLSTCMAGLHLKARPSESANEEEDNNKSLTDLKLSPNKADETDEAKQSNHDDSLTLNDCIDKDAAHVNDSVRDQLRTLEQAVAEVNKKDEEETDKKKQDKEKASSKRKSRKGRTSTRGRARGRSSIRIDKPRQQKRCHSSMSTFEYDRSKISGMIAAFNQCQTLTGTTAAAVSHNQIEKMVASQDADGHIQTMEEINDIILGKRMVEVQGELSNILQHRDETPSESELSELIESAKEFKKKGFFSMSNLRSDLASSISHMLVPDFSKLVPRKGRESKTKATKGSDKEESARKSRTQSTAPRGRQRSQQSGKPTKRRARSASISSIRTKTTDASVGEETATSALHGSLTNLASSPVDTQKEGLGEHISRTKSRERVVTKARQRARNRSRRGQRTIVVTDENDGDTVNAQNLSRRGQRTIAVDANEKEGDAAIVQNRSRRGQRTIAASNANGDDTANKVSTSARKRTGSKVGARIRTRSVGVGKPTTSPGAVSTLTKPTTDSANLSLNKENNANSATSRPSKTHRPSTTGKARRPSSKKPSERCKSFEGYDSCPIVSRPGTRRRRSSVEPDKSGVSKNTGSGKQTVATATKKAPRRQASEPVKAATETKTAAEAENSNNNGSDNKKTAVTPTKKAPRRQASAPAKHVVPSTTPEAEKAPETETEEKGQSKSSGGHGRNKSLSKSVGNFRTSVRRSTTQASTPDESEPLPTPETEADKKTQAQSSDDHGRVDRSKSMSSSVANRRLSVRRCSTQLAQKIARQTLMEGLKQHDESIAELEDPATWVKRRECKRGAPALPSPN